MTIERDSTTWLLPNRAAVLGWVRILLERWQALFALCTLRHIWLPQAATDLERPGRTTTNSPDSINHSPSHPPVESSSDSPPKKTQLTMPPSLPPTNSQPRQPAAAQPSPTASISASSSSKHRISTTSSSRQLNPSSASASTAPKASSSSKVSKRPLQKPVRPLADPRTAYSIPAHVAPPPSLLLDDEYDEEGSEGGSEGANDESEDEEMASSTTAYPRKDWSRAMRMFVSLALPLLSCLFQLLSPLAFCLVLASIYFDLSLSCSLSLSTALLPPSRPEHRQVILLTAATAKDFDSRHEPSLFLDAAYAARRIEVLREMRGGGGSGGDGDGARRR